MLKTMLITSNNTPLSQKNVKMVRSMALLRRSVANDMKCSMILARPDPNVLLQMQNFGLPLFDLKDQAEAGRIRKNPEELSKI